MHFFQTQNLIWCQNVSKLLYSKQFWVQFKYSAIVSWQSFLMGTVIGWPILVLPALVDEQKPYHFSLQDTPWIIGITPVGGLLGAALAWLLIDVIGRKLLSILGTVPFIVGYAIMIPSVTMKSLCLGRILHGIAISIICTCIPVYSGEIMESRYRGSLTTLPSVVFCLGYLYSILTGSYLSVEMIGLASTVPCVICFFLLFFLPETPYFLLAKGQDNEAMASLVKLRGHYEVDEEFQAIKAYTILAAREKEPLLKLLRKSHNLRMLLIVLGASLATAFNGATGLGTWTALILETGHSGISPSNVALGTGIAMMIVSVIGMLVVDKCGRRFTMFFFYSVIASSILTSGLYFTLDDLGYDVKDYSWILAVAIVMSSALQVLHGLVGTLLSECFSSNFKAFANWQVISLLQVFVFAGNTLFEVTFTTLPSYVVFYVFFAVSFVIVLLLYKYMPETRGKSFQQIQNIFSRAPLVSIEESVEPPVETECDPYSGVHL